MVESFRDRPYAQRRFRAIVDHARAHNPFYRRWISDPDNPPIVTREVFLDHNDEILNGNPPSDSTSGSTGVPIRFSHSPEWVQMAKLDSARFVKALGGRIPGVQIVYAHYRNPGPHVLHITSSSDEQIGFILAGRREFNCQAITTYPTNAEILCRAVLERGEDMSFIRRFGMYGEAVEPHQRELVGRAFPNARIWTNYSSKEFGIIAAMCQGHGDYHHIMAHRLGVEILRDDGTPAAAGERGRVIVTDYLNRRSPFIRYDIGDLAVPGVCPCGQDPRPALREILGKVRGFLVHRNGNRIAYVDLLVALRGIKGLRQYQVIQHGIEQFTLKVIADRVVDEEVRPAFAGHFGYLPEELIVEYVDEIPRAANGKQYFAICNIPDVAPGTPASVE